MPTISDVTTPPHSGLPHIDALLDNGPGWNWLTPSRTTIFYSFSLAGSNAADLGTRISGAPVAFNGAQETAAEDVLDLISDLTGITFVEVADGTTADIHFAAADVIAADAEGLTSKRWSHNLGGGDEVTSYVADAWVYLDNVEHAGTNAAPAAGNAGFEVLLKYIASAMGLQDPDAGDPPLPEDEDTTAFTVMADDHDGGPYSDYRPYDMAALLFLYGDDGLLDDLGQGTDGLYLMGTAEDDDLEGGAEDDKLRGSGGDDRIEGNAGDDTAVYSGAFAAYNIAIDGALYIITGPEGTDTLVEMERAEFSDQTVLLLGAVINHPPTGGITLQGSVTEGATLTSTSTIADVDGLGDFSYQWQQSADGQTWVDIEDADNASFTLTEEQVGERVRLVVTYTDDQNSEELVTSSASAVVANANDAPTGELEIDGTALQGRTLTADTSDIEDDDGTGTFSFRWQSSANGSAWTDIAGATGSTLRLGQAQVGLQVRAIASYTDGNGSAESVTSDPTAAVANVNDAPTGSVQVSGTAHEGAVLTATNTLADIDGLGAISYRWQSSPNGSTWTDIAGATAATFTVGAEQVGLRLRAVASYTDGLGTAESRSSNPTAVVGGTNDPPSGDVTIAGEARIGVTFSANTSELADPDGLGTLSYQWQASIGGTNWRDLPGATASTFKPGTALEGEQIRVVVSYTDGLGKLETVVSAATDALAIVIDGTVGADVLIGSGADETINGLAGNDRITGAGGEDTIDGGSGIDTAVYARVFADYDVLAEGRIVQADVGDENIDSLVAIERLEFSDLSLAFDIDGNAGNVARTIGAVFGAAALQNRELVGIGMDFADGGLDADELMDLALSARLGAAYTNTAEVDLLFTNLVGRAPTAGERAFWVGTLESGQFSQHSLAMMAAELDLNEQNIGLTGLADEGLAYVPVD